MYTICPYCNGMENLHAGCTNCQHTMHDAGKLADYYGPYSPYRPIDDLKMTNGHPDLALNECIHVLHCSHCGAERQIAVPEHSP